MKFTIASTCRLVKISNSSPTLLKIVAICKQWAFSSMVHIQVVHQSAIATHNNINIINLRIKAKAINGLSTITNFCKVGEYYKRFSGGADSMNITQPLFFNHS